MKTLKGPADVTSPPCMLAGAGVLAQGILSDGRHWCTMLGEGKDAERQEFFLALQVMPHLLDSLAGIFRVTTKAQSMEGPLS